MHCGYLIGREGRPPSGLQGQVIERSEKFLVDGLNRPTAEALPASGKDGTGPNESRSPLQLASMSGRT